MTLILTALSGIISLAGAIPYIRDVWRGKTKPRVASWLVWASLTGTAAIASLHDGQLASGVLATCMTVSCATIAILGMVKNGTVSFERFDIVCFVFAMLGLVLWQLLGSPSIAVLAVVTVDAVASLPTVRHAWKAPHEETLAEFIMAGLASAVALLAAGSWEATAVLYPLYIACFDLTVAALILRGRRLTYNESYDKEFPARN